MSTQPYTMTMLVEEDMSPGQPVGSPPVQK